MSREEKNDEAVRQVKYFAYFLIIFAVFLVIAIVIPNFIKYDLRRRPHYNSCSNSNVKSAYTAAQAYFIDHPNGAINMDALRANGFQQTEGFIVTAVGNKSNLKITSTHPEGDKIFSVNPSGEIESSFKNE